MLTITQVSVLFPKTPCASSNFAEDDNNNSPVNMSCGAMALKLLSRASGPRRCLFGLPSSEETQRIIMEDQEATRARMILRWGWDLAKEAPSTPSNWQWETVKAPLTSTPLPRKSTGRHHPYASRRPTTEFFPSPLTVPDMLSPLPNSPRLDVDASPASTSSSSGTSTLPASMSPSNMEPSTPSSQYASSIATSLDWKWTSEEEEDSCRGDSDTESDCEEKPSSRDPSTPPNLGETCLVQTRLTDFWRTRRNSGDEIGGKTASPTSCNDHNSEERSSHSNSCMIQDVS